MSSMVSSCFASSQQIKHHFITQWFSCLCTDMQTRSHCLWCAVETSWLACCHTYHRRRAKPRSCLSTALQLYSVTVQPRVQLTQQIWQELIMGSCQQEVWVLSMQDLASECSAAGFVVNSAAMTAQFAEGNFEAAFAACGLTTNSL